MSAGQRRCLISQETQSYLWNPTNPSAEPALDNFRRRRTPIGQPILVVSASSERELGPAFATIVQQGAGALLISADTFFANRVRGYPFSRFTHLRTTQKQLHQGKIVYEEYGPNVVG
jgi:hypothetical protein